jgi:hypothetical protein
MAGIFDGNVFDASVFDVGSSAVAVLPTASCTATAGTIVATGTTPVVASVGGGPAKRRRGGLRSFAPLPAPVRIAARVVLPSAHAHVSAGSMYARAGAVVSLEARAIQVHTHRLKVSGILNPSEEELFALFAEL